MNVARQYAVKVRDLNSRRSMMGPEPTLGGRRRATVRFVPTRRHKRIRAIMRMVHGNLKRGLTYVDCGYHQCSRYTYPTSLMRLCTAIGKTVPPVLDPSAINPSATPLRRLNQCATTATSGAYTAPAVSFK